MKFNKLALFIGVSTLLIGCNKSAVKPKDFHLINEEQYNLCTYSQYVANFSVLNCTVELTSRNGESTYRYFCQYDYGKVYMETSFAEVGYLYFHEGTYNETDHTWSYDVYYEDEGTMIKRTTENDYIPDDMALPADMPWLASFNEMEYNKTTHCYELKEESKIIYGDTYYNIKAKFENGKVVYQTYSYRTSYSPDVEWVDEITISNYGNTHVTLPVVE